MNLSDLRDKIDDIDNRILELFIKRMDICREVALYKKEHNQPVLQGNRETQVLDNIREKTPTTLVDGSAVLFTNIMDISKSLQINEISPIGIFTKIQPFTPKLIAEGLVVGCQGDRGSYQEAACHKIFGEDKAVTFFNRFEDVFKAVQDGKIDFGVLPIRNSTAGSVTETYDLLRQYDVYISARTDIEINHCIAVKDSKSTLDDVCSVYSHEQALSQCSDFIDSYGFTKISCGNTATAAKLIETSSDSKAAAICSVDCAKLHGLHILATNIAKVNPNYTRFICVTKNICGDVTKLNPTISIALTIPNTSGSLYRMLTTFAVNNLNLEHLESRSSENGNFDIMFYLDFKGSILDNKVANLLSQLQNDQSIQIKFLGNYGDV